MDFSFRRFREMEAVKNGQTVERSHTKRKPPKDNGLKVLEFPPDNKYLTKEITTQEALIGQKEILTDEIEKLKKEIGFLVQEERVANIRNQREEKINEDFDNRYLENGSQNIENRTSEAEKTRQIVNLQRISADLDDRISDLRKGISAKSLQNLRVEVGILKNEVQQYIDNIEFYQKEIRKTRKIIEIQTQKLGLSFLDKNKKYIAQLREKLYEKKDEYDEMKEIIFKLEKQLEESPKKNEIETQIEENILIEQLRLAQRKYERTKQEYFYYREKIGKEEIQERQIQKQNYPRSSNTKERALNIDFSESPSKQNKTNIFDRFSTKNVPEKPKSTGYVANRNAPREYENTVQQKEQFNQRIREIAENNKRIQEIQKIQDAKENEENKINKNDKQNKDEKSKEKEEIKEEKPEQKEQEVKQVKEKKKESDEFEEFESFDDEKHETKEENKNDKKDNKSKIETKEENKPIDKKETKIEKQNIPIQPVERKIPNFVSVRRAITILGSPDFDQIIENAKKYGKVESTKVLTTNSIEVVFDNHSEASSALVGMNGRKFGPKVVIIKWSEKQPEPHQTQNTDSSSNKEEIKENIANKEAQQKIETRELSKQTLEPDKKHENNEKQEDTIEFPSDDSDTKENPKENVKENKPETKVDDKETDEEIVIEDSVDVTEDNKETKESDKTGDKKEEDEKRKEEKKEEKPPSKDSQESFEEIIIESSEDVKDDTKPETKENKEKQQSDDEIIIDESSDVLVNESSKGETKEQKDNSTAADKKESKTETENKEEKTEKEEKENKESSSFFSSSSFSDKEDKGKVEETKTGEKEKETTLQETKIVENQESSSSFSFDKSDEESNKSLNKTNEQTNLQQIKQNADASKSNTATMPKEKEKFDPSSKTEVPKEESSTFYSASDSEIIIDDGSDIDVTNQTNNNAETNTTNTQTNNNNNDNNEYSFHREDIIESYSSIEIFTDSDAIPTKGEVEQNTENCPVKTNQNQNQTNSNQNENQTKNDDDDESSSTSDYF